MEINVDNNEWPRYEQEYFKTAVKAAGWIKKNKLKEFNIYFKIDKRWELVMFRDYEETTIKLGYKIPKVLTDLVRWKGEE